MQDRSSEQVLPVDGLTHEDKMHVHHCAITSCYSARSCDSALKNYPVQVLPMTQDAGITDFLSTV